MFAGGGEQQGTVVMRFQFRMCPLFRGSIPGFYFVGS